MSEPIVIVTPAETRTEYVTKTVNVHEHRAPTDKSIELLREMEQKIRDQVEQSVRLTDNGFECVVQQWRDAYADDLVTIALFSLNGKRMQSEVKTSLCTEIRPVDVDGVFIKLRDEIAKTIANETMSSFVATLSKSWVRGR